MKLSDYVVSFIEGLGIKDVFYLPGGGAMHLNDSLGKNKNINSVCMLHEASASIAAESYARISESYGACFVTSGPGSTNAVTGLAGAYLDSTPVIFVSGQAKRADLVGTQKIRQFGIQEVDIVSIVKPITKYAVQILDEKSIRYELEKAAFMAKYGRPGPVWIDIPLDIQAMQIEPSELESYYDSIEECKPKIAEETVFKVIDLFNSAKRPVLIAGNGIRLAGAVKELSQLIECLGVPVLTSWNGADLIEEKHSLYFGRPGAAGQRYANLIQQKSDLVITIGTRLNLLSTGYNFDAFLKNAKHIMVDIDKYEMQKKSVHPFLSVECDAKDFILALLKNVDRFNTNRFSSWIEMCVKLKKEYPVDLQNNLNLSTYQIIDEISTQMTGDDIYQFTSSGTAADIAMQTFRFKKGQRGFLTKGLASMGFDLPACIGSSLASGGKRVVCVTGDGGFIMNIQELEVLRRLKLPVKIFVIDNGGYSMIYNSQYSNFDHRLTGCTEESGLTLPDILRVSEAFGIKTFSLDSRDSLQDTVAQMLEFKGPSICVAKVDIAQKILPRQANYVDENGQMASRPLEDLYPFLPEDELKRIMDS